MSRLTEKDEQGNWCLKGLKWDDLRAGKTLTKEMRDLLYGALWKLMEYEDTGLSPDDMTAEEAWEIAREKQQLMKTQIGEYFYWCPRCGSRRSIRQKHNFCHDCGQAIDWGRRL